MYSFNRLVNIQYLYTKFNENIKLIIKDELEKNEQLGSTKDKKRIFLVESSKSPFTMLEIGKLREQTFQSVGEGTGKEFDLDEYDEIYKHIVLWDDEEMEIIGSYRLGEISNIIENHGVNKIYNSELFDFSDDFIEKLKSSIELGRSFVQSKYWGSYALDYLWQGIGAYLSNYPNVQYLWGAVSISDSFPLEAKSLIVHYHQKWFGDDNNLAMAKNPFKINVKNIEYSKEILNAQTPNEDFLNLKKELRKYELSCPILLRKYVDLCEYGGAKFLDFGIDEGFANSIDCLILVDLSMIKEDFRKRYYTIVEEAELIN